MLLSIFGFISWLGFCKSWSITPLEDFSPPPQPIVSDIAKLSKIQREYLQESTTKWNYPAIINLDYYLSKLSGKVNCFNLLDNFQKINIHPCRIPIILRSPMPLVQTYSDVYGDYNLKLIFGAKSITAKNISVPETPPLFECIPSGNYYWKAVDSTIQTTLQSICFIADIKRFFRRAKPGNCNNYFGIFPPTYFDRLEHYLKYPEADDFMKDFPTFYYFPSSVPLINVLVQLESMETDTDEVTKIRNWKHGFDEQSGTYAHHTIFVALLIEVREERFESFGYFRNAKVFKICYTCQNKHSGRRGTLADTNVQTFDRSEIVMHAFPTSEENMFWVLSFWSKTSNILASEMLRHTYTCRTKSFKELWLRISAGSSLPTKVGIGHSNVLKSIMRNFTLLGSYKSGHCTYGGKVKFLIDVDTSQYEISTFSFPYYVNDVFASFRLVGCGTQGLTLLPFQELISVYDAFTWIGIVSTILCVAVSMKLLRENSNIRDNVMSVLKVVLEQGDSATGKPRFRYLFALLLLMGIILSNAYKNNNVYNMVIPRRPILYEQLSEMLRDKFQLYTRTDYMALNQYPRNNEYTVPTEPLKRNYVLIKTEIQATLEDYRNFIFHNRAGSVLFNSLNESGILDAAQVHHGILPMFKKFIEEWVSKLEPGWLKSTSIRNLRPLVMELYPGMRSLEKLQLLKSAGECGKAVIILPDYVCREYQKFLITEMNIKHVFVGREKFADLDWTFSLSGWIPPHVIKRVQMMGESGVWHWWIKTMTSIYSDEVNPIQPVKAANMEGNIIIIFIVWVAGLMVTILCFLFEIFNHSCTKNPFVSIFLSLKFKTKTDLTKG